MAPSTERTIRWWGRTRGLLILALLGSCSWHQVQVVDQAGTPIEDANVWLTAPGYWSASIPTGADGRCRLTWPLWRDPTQVVLGRDGMEEEAVAVWQGWPSTIELPRYSRGSRLPWMLTVKVGQPISKFESIVRALRGSLVRDVAPEPNISDLEARLALSRASSLWKCEVFSLVIWLWVNDRGLIVDWFSNASPTMWRKSHSSS